MRSVIRFECKLYYSGVYIQYMCILLTENDGTSWYALVLYVGRSNNPLIQDGVRGVSPSWIVVGLVGDRPDSSTEVSKAP